MRSYIDSEDGEESFIPPSTDRGRSTKRLPVFSKQRDRKGPTKMLPVVDIIHEHDSPSKMERKNCGSRSQCHICGKSIKRLNRHLRKVHGKATMDKTMIVKGAHGYVVRACPICSKVVERMRHHIKRTHKICDEVSLISLMSQAYPVTRDEGVRLFFFRKKNLLPLF